TRFQNKRLIIKNYMQALFNLAVVAKPSAQALRQLIDQANTHTKALKVLDVPVDSKHHTLLHFDNKANKEINEPIVEIQTPEPQPSTSQGSFYCREGQLNSQVLLATAVILTFDKAGNAHKCRAFLDIGSQLNFLTESMLKKLNLESNSLNTSISGIMQTTANVTRSTTIKIKSRYNNYNATLHCLIVPKITGMLPSMTFSNAQLPIPSNIKLADPQFNVSRPVDLLIGAELFFDLYCSGKIKSARNQPCLQKIHLGWVVGGRWEYLEQAPQTSMHVLDDHLTKFWELEEYQNANVMSATELQFRLPFKADTRQLGSSRQNALNRLFSSERKLDRNPSFRSEHNRFMDEFRSYASSRPPEK
ncbi:hypothetical protein ILUMI_19044, partial [Ignelater luminosus]